MAARLGKRVLIDFDGVLRELGKGLSGLAIKGAVGAVRGLKKLGYEVVVFTTRASNGPTAVKRVSDWFDSTELSTTWRNYLGSDSCLFTCSCSDSKPLLGGVGWVEFVFNEAHTTPPGEGVHPPPP